jgi:hypothetical protein
MTSLVAVGGLAMIAVDAVIGVRLLALARRTRKLPEAALGTAFLLLGAIGYPLTTLARRGVIDAAATNELLMGLGLLVQDVACFAVVLATAAIFRPGSRGARAAIGVAAAWFAASWLGQLATTGFDPLETGPAYAAGLAARTTAFGWAAAEALRAWLQGRRRLRLGLAEPLVVNRFLLYALGMGGVFAAFLLFVVGQLTTPNPSQSGWVLAATGALGVATAVPTWLAFLPPVAWRRRFAPAPAG